MILMFYFNDVLIDDFFHVVINDRTGTSHAISVHKVHVTRHTIE